MAVNRFRQLLVLDPSSQRLVIRNFEACNCITSVNTDPESETAYNI